jgi:hypothetical protein
MSTVGTVIPLTSVADPVARRVAELRDAADRIVGSTFYGTLLSIQRESGLKAPVGHGGRGEEVFRAQLDQVFAERAGQAGGFNLSDSIVARYQQRVRAIAATSVAGGGAA